MEKIEPERGTKAHTIINLSDINFESITSHPDQTSPSDILEVVRENRSNVKNGKIKKKASLGSSISQNSSNPIPIEQTNKSNHENTIIKIRNNKDSTKRATIHSHTVVLNPPPGDPCAVLSTSRFSDINDFDIYDSLTSLNNNEDDFDITKMISIDSGLDESISDDDKLRLLNNRLEGTLTTLGNEAKCWLRERAQLAAEVSSLKSHLTCSRITCEEAIIKAENLTKELISTKKHYETQIYNLSLTINDKTTSIHNLTQSLNKTKEDYTNLSLKLQKYDANSTEKKQISNLLKEKITSLCLEINQLKSVQQQNISIELELRNQIENLQKSKQWYSDQLNISKASQERLSKELLQMKEFLHDGSLHNHKLSHDNTCLQSQLVCMKTALIDAKRSMSKQLDAIRNEMVEREALFATIEKDKLSYEELLRQKIITLNETQIRVDSLNKGILDYQGEITRISNEQIQTELHLKESQEEKRLLEAKIAEQEDSLSRYSVKIENYQQIELDMNQKYNQLAEKFGHNELMLQGLREEREKLSQTIQAMIDEKTNLIQFTERTKEEMIELNERLAASEVLVNTRNETINNYYAQIIHLENEATRLREDLSQKEGLIMNLEREKDELYQTVKSTGEENIQLKERLEMVQRDLEDLRISLTEEYENKLTALKLDQEMKCNEMTEQIKASLSEIKTLKETIDGLMETKRLHQELTEKYSILYAENVKNLEDLKKERKESADALKKLELESKQRYEAQKADISRHVKNIESLENEIARLNEEISALHQAKNDAIEENTKFYQERISLLTIELDKIRFDYSELQKALEAARDQYMANEESYKEEIAAHLQALSKLESRLCVIPSLEAKQKKLMSDLEMYLGKELGIRQSYKTLQNHANNLEIALAKKEELIAQMSHERDMNNRESLLTQNLYELSLQDSPQKETIIECKTVNQNMATQLVHSQSIDSSQVIMATHYQSAIVPGSPPDLYLLENELQRVQLERDKLNEAYEEVNSKLSETLAKLTFLENSFESQQNNIDQLQRSNSENLQGKLELQKNLNEVSLQNQSLTLRNEELSRLLEVESKRTQRLEQDQREICNHHSMEIESLRKIIQSATNHLKTVNKELNETREDKKQLNTFLSQIRGTLKGCLEKHRSLMQINSELSSKTVSIDIAQIECMMGEALSTQSYLFNKPLSTIDVLLKSMHGEINDLETKIEDHTIVVHDSIHHWKLVSKFIAENLPKADFEEVKAKIAM